MILIRRGAEQDLRQVSDLLNDLVATGAGTALTRPIRRQDLADWLGAMAARSAWHVALDGQGALLGLQWIGPGPALPAEACDIGTFVRSGSTGPGIGSRLFDATRQAAIDLGYDWISATIRAENSGGLIYYQSRGFRDWGRLDMITRANGSKVDRRVICYDLRG